MKLNTPAAKFFGPELARCLDFLYANRVKCEASQSQAKVLASQIFMVKDVSEVARFTQDPDAILSMKKPR